MDTEGQREPLAPSRGLVPLAVFCRRTGLDSAPVEALLEEGTIEGVVNPSGRVVGVYADVLPTAEDLRALGLDVGDDYNPDDIRGSEDVSDDAHEAEGERSTWYMSGDGATS